MQRLVATGLVFPPLAVLSALVLLFACVGCAEEEADDDSSPADDDDDNSENEDCDPGTVLDENLPAEFLDDFPDGCVPEACGVGPWGNLEIGPDTVFVDVHDGEEGGDGSQAAPFASVQAGLNAAGSSGGMVAVAAGTYAENVVADDDHDGVHLAGRCPELVVLDGSGGDEADVTILFDGFMGDETWSLFGFTVTGGPAGGVKLDTGHLELLGSRVVENDLQGIVAEGSASELSLADVTVADSRPDDDGTYGGGIEIRDSASMVATDCTVEGNADIGIYVRSRAHVSLTNVDVSETEPEGDGAWGRGIAVHDHAVLEAENCRIEGNAEIGISVTDDSTAHLTNVEIRETRPWADGSFGRAINVQTGSSLEAFDCLFEDNPGTSIFTGLDSSVVLSGVEVYGTRSGVGGKGIQVQDSTTLVAEDSVIESATEAGITVCCGDSTATLTNVDVRGTRPGGEELGVGLQIRAGGTLVAEDCTIEGNTGGGIYQDGDCTVSLTRVDVVDTKTLADGTLGRGINVQNGAHLEVADCTVEGSTEVGILAVTEDTTVSLVNTTVGGTSRSSLMTVAAGVVAQEGATLTASGLVVERTEGPGLTSGDLASLSCAACDLHDNTFAGAVAMGASLELTSTSIAGNTADAAQGGGIGVYAADHLGASSLILDDTTIESHPYAAVWLSGDGSYDIRNSTLVGGYGYEETYRNGDTVLLHGDGVVATNVVPLWDGAQGLILEDNEIHDAYRAGVILDGSTAWLEDNTFENNATDLVWQDCDDIEGPEGLGAIPDAELCPQYNEPIAPLELRLHLLEPDPLG